MSMEPKSNDSTAELTKAERTARGSVPESVEGAMPDPAKKQAMVTDWNTTNPRFPLTMPLGGTNLPSEDSFETSGDDLEDASARSLIEARQDCS